MDDIEIIAALRKEGRHQASGVAALYHQYARKMLRYFVHHGVSPEESEDLLQDTFIKIANGAPTYREQGSAGAWFWTIARNCLMDFHRRQSSSVIGHSKSVLYEDELQPADETWSPGARADREELISCVSGGLHRYGADLPENAYALTLYIEGASISEIACHIGRSAAATKEFLSQCRKKLRAYISHCLLLIQADS